MKILGAGSLASRLRLLLEVATVLWLVIGALNAFLMLALLIHPTGPARGLLNMTTLYAVPPAVSVPAGLVESRDIHAQIDTQLLAYVNYRPGSRWFLLGIAAGYLLVWGAYFAIIQQMRLLFGSLTSGEPFLRSNGLRLRVIGWLLIAAWLIEHAWEWALVLHMRSDLTLAGVTPNVPFAFVVEDLQPALLFVGAAVLVLAEIFRLGAALQEEQTLTI